MPSRSYGPRLAALVLSGALALAQPTTGQPQTPPAGYLSLADALGRASAGDPSIDATTARLTAADAALRQAAVKPNAALDVQVENFAGTGRYALADRSEATVSYERPWERGGKREARTSQARAEIAVARLRGEVKRLDFIRDVQIAYGEALAAEAELLVADARLIAAQKSQADIARRVRSARDPLFAGSRAEAMTAQAEIARDRARDALRTAKAALAAYWGGGTDFALRLDDFFSVTPPAAGPALETPDLALLDAERDVATAAVGVAQAGSIPDPKLRAGVRYLGDGDDVAFVVGGSMPLGVRRSNRANVERAQAERSVAEAEIQAARVIRERQRLRLEAQMRALATESERVRAEVIPHAIRTVEQVTDGFNRGGFQYIDVTEAERALADARARRVEVLRDFHKAQAELDRLSGKHRGLTTLSSQERR